MVLPPGIPNGIQGPDKRNITDLYNQVAALNAALVTIGQDLALIRDILNGAAGTLVNNVALTRTAAETVATRVGWLSGVNAPSATQQGSSLYGYLTRLLGFFSQVSPTGANSIQPALLQLITDGVVTNLLLQGSRTDGNGLPLTNAIANIQDVLGSVNDLPNGSTIKDLLRSIDVNALRSADCCEEGNGGGTPPDNPENAAPTDLCESATRRASSWDVVGTKTIGGVEHTVYRPRFTFSGGFFGPLAADGNAVDGDGQAFRADPNVAGVVCVAWDFTGNAAVPTEVGREQAGTAAGAIDSTLTNAPALSSGSTYTRGRLSANFDRCGQTTSQWASWNFAVPTASGTPALNVFAGYVNVGCPS